MDIHHYASVQNLDCTTPRVGPEVNYGLGEIMMCQCRFILGKENLPFWGVVLIMEETGQIWNICIPSFQFYCKPTAALKN